MKKFLSVLLAIVMLAAVSVPTASAHDYVPYGGRHPGVQHREFRRGGGGFAGNEFLGGLVLGGILGGILAGALATQHQASPPVYAAPQPSCYTRPGHWSQVPYGNGGYYTQYEKVWVPAQTVCQ